MKNIDELWMETSKHINCNLDAPAYIFDKDILNKGIKNIKEKLSFCNNLCYAMKANPFLISVINENIDYFEVCSPGEYEICYRNNIPANKIIVSGVNKTEKSIEHILKLSEGKAIYTLESLLHYEILSTLAKKLNMHINLIVRLTSGNQFGMDELDVDKIFEKIKDDKYCNIIGIHYFSGTQKKLKRINEELTYLNEYASYLKNKFSIKKLLLEYGPGLSVSYFQNDKPISNEEQLIELNNMLKNVNNFDIINIELGRFIAADCGCFISEVQDIKTNHDVTYLIMDSGLHQIQYYGSMMGMKLPYIISSAKNKNTKEYTMCGALCSINDVLARNISLNELKIGDKLLFQKCGAYSMTEGISTFLSRDIPAIYIYSDKDGYTCIRNRIETNYLNDKKGEN